MAVDASRGSIFVDDDRSVGNQSGLRMALGARDVGVAAGEGKVGAGVVIEAGGYPALGVVAIDAVGLAVFSDKLGVVSVPVAGFALRGGTFEARFVAGSGFVTITAGDGTMRAQ